MTRLFRPPEELEGNRLRQVQPLPSGDDPDTTPYIAIQLLEYLQLRFSDQLPRGEPSLREVDRRIGKQEVIDHLRELYQRQKQDTSRT